MDNFSQKILSWFETNGRRDLPWQQEINPYRVWVSEIMLQQTQVATVIPYYTRFLSKFPSLNSLANASVDEVMELWTGLGYYARGRNLHKAANIVSKKFSGELPSTVDELLQLPGIGRSTAGAIVSLAYGGQAPILDGNVKRVLTRAHAIKGWPGERAIEDQLWALAEKYTPRLQTNLYTQAIMDLGATICTRSSPKCGDCPISEQCLARLHDNQAAYPEPKPRKILPIKETIFLIVHTSDKKFLLKKRPQKGIWGGLWCFPEISSLNLIEKWCTELGLREKIAISTLPVFSHTFSHYKLWIEPALIPCKKTEKLNLVANDWIWYNKEKPTKIGLPAPIVRLIKSI